MLSLLPIAVGSVLGVVGVEMAHHYRHVLTEVVPVVAEVLLRRLPAPAVLLPDIELSVAMRIVLWGLGCSFQPWQVVLDTCKLLFAFLVAGFHAVID